MKYGTVYTGQFVNLQVDTDNVGDQQVIQVEIYNTFNLIDDADPVTEYELEMADNPLTIEVVDTDEDKYTPIRSKQATINIFTSDSINIQTFADDGDLKWKMYVYIVDDSDVKREIFQGFVVLDELSQDFQPNPNILSITAICGLGLLKDVKVSNATGGIIRNKWRIADYLTWILAKTGLSLPLNVVNNVRVRDFETSNFYDALYLDPVTFEASVNETIDCYTALENILGEDCYLFQQWGSWWIVRVNEITDSWFVVGSHYYNIAQYDTDGNYLSSYQADYSKRIGKNETMWWMGDDTLVSLKRPYKSTKVTYNYNLPSELVKNYDFTRGAENSSLSGSGYTAFDLDEWILQTGDGANREIPSNNVYIRRTYNANGYEDTREVVITQPTLYSGTSAKITYIESQPIEVNANDKFNISVDYRLMSQTSGTNANNILVNILLVGDDGNFYSYQRPVIGVSDTEFWIQNSDRDTTTASGILVTIDDTDELTKYKTVSFTEETPIPVSGKLYIRLNGINQTSSTVDTEDVAYSNLRFNYIPYINGSYSKYTGQYCKVTRLTDTDNFKSERESTTYISDSPSPLFKGALFYLSGEALIVNITTDGFSSNIVELPGYQTYLFKPGMYIRIEGTASNDGNYRVLYAEYHVIPDQTYLYLDRDLTTEIGRSINIYEYKFSLATDFFDYSKQLTTSPGIYFPFSKIQAFAVWNQYKRGLRAFEGTVDQMDTNVVSGDYVLIPDLISPVLLLDLSLLTNTKVFMFISNEQDFYNNSFKCFIIETGANEPGGDGLLHEITSDTFEFKYISE